MLTGAGDKVREVGFLGGSVCISGAIGEEILGDPATG